ncbi:methionine ABC transporter ATP-binding protein [Derxia lacustris]|uniref:methionine ABC transporter ATP-binding protein n=1 Tax=Derxia lacustris TaxID=764842 RepID=UPI000A177F44|nr:ATP-binding cassette domain-containing protein [Derxia lacustris]
MSAPLIRLDTVSKTFVLPRNGVFHAVRDVSLDIPRGSAFGVIGMSGAGKSTLLRLINLLERPDAGRVTVDGVDLTALSRSRLRAARRGIGMIFQQFNLLLNATVEANVAFPLDLDGLPRAQVAKRVAECLDIVGLADKARSYPAQLSGGQKQRVAIARALTTRPGVLLCDEPTSALDPQTTRSILDTLAAINRDHGVTLVVVTHELEVVRRLCDEVAVMEDGRVADRFALDTDTHAPATDLARELLASLQQPAPLSVAA